MKDSIKKLVIAVLVVLVAVNVWSYITKDATPTNDMTKSGYLKIVEENYEPDDAITLAETKCAYSYLIDEYGVEETMSMDFRVDADEKDVDPRLFEAVDKCL